MPGEEQLLWSRGNEHPRAGSKGWQDPAAHPSAQKALLIPRVLQIRAPALRSGPVGTAELRAWAVPWVLLPELGFAILSWDSWRASQGQNLRRHLHFSPDFPS